MLISRVIEIGLDVDDPIVFFNNTRLNILKYIRALYVGKCFKKCLIVKILKIIQYSEPVVNQSQSNSYVTLNVWLEIQGIVFNQGDIINGCKVINIDKTGSMLCNSKYACVFIRANKYFQSVKIGQLINAVVIDAKYYPNDIHITVMANHFTFSREGKTFYFGGDLTAEQSEIIGEIFIKINKEEAKDKEVKKQNGKGWDYFNTLLYAHKKRDMTTPKDAVKIHIQDIKKGWISRSSKLDLTEPYAFYYSDPPKDLVVNTELGDFAAYVAVLYDYLNMRRTLRKMIEIYNTEALLKEHKNIWQIMQNSKF